jgi:hypothetical protein
MSAKSPFKDSTIASISCALALKMYRPIISAFWMTGYGSLMTCGRGLRNGFFRSI